MHERGGDGREKGKEDTGMNERQRRTREGWWREERIGGGGSWSRSCFISG